MNAFVQHLKTLADGTKRILLRLEDAESGETTVLSCSYWNRDLVLVEPVEKAPETAKIPIPPVEHSPTGGPLKFLQQPPIVEMSPSLIA